MSVGRLAATVLAAGVLVIGASSSLGVAKAGPPDPADADEDSQSLRASAERELRLTRAANEVERGAKALERERESLRWANRLLERRSNESLRKLDAYREHRIERAELQAVRARRLYKLARGGGVLELMFEDGQDGRLTPAQRMARGRTLRRLVDRDLEQLRVHADAEDRARAELLTATRELSVLSALETVATIRSHSLEQGREALGPALSAAHRARQRVAYTEGVNSELERALLASVEREREDLLRHRGLDLLEAEALVRPVDGAVVGAFGDYDDPLLEVPMHRNGIELDARPEDMVRALAPGRVAFVGALPGFERVVVVDHGGGYLSLTGRLLSVWVEEGETIEAGRVLGRVGAKAVDDGLGTTAYVEIRHGRRPIDPAPYLRPR